MVRTVLKKATEARQNPRLDGFYKRVAAWWDGVEPPPPSSSAGTKTPTTKTSKPAPRTTSDALWSPERIAAAEGIWGTGAISPRTGTALVQMLIPAELDPSRALLYFGSGLGKALMHFVAATETYITAYESSPELVNRFERSAKGSKFAGKLSIRHFDATKLEIKPRSYNCVAGCEFFHAIEDKERFLESVMDGLKGYGHLIFTDFMVADEAAKSPALDLWKTGEPEGTFPWSERRYLDKLKSLKFDVQPPREQTPAYLAAIMKAVTALVAREKELAKLDEATAGATMTELDLWARRVAALQSGQLRVVHVSARKGFDDDGGVKTLSDW